MSSFTIEHIREAQRLMASIPAAPPAIRIIVSDHMVVGPLEDWSGVRSKGRAARRRKRGYPQRIRLFYKPDTKLLRMADGTVVGHPATVAELKRRIAERNLDRNPW